MATDVVALVCRGGGNFDGFVYVPHIGMRLNGSRRWIGLGQLLFSHRNWQKLASSFFSAAWFARLNTKPQTALGFVLPLAIVSLPAVLVLGEVDWEQRL